jgi:hypothetical protein
MRSQIEQVDGKALLGGELKGVVDFQVASHFFPL